MSVNWKKLLAKRTKKYSFTIVKPSHLTEEEWATSLMKLLTKQKDCWRTPIISYSDDLKWIPIVPLPKLPPRSDAVDALAYSLRYTPITINPPTMVASMLAEEKEDKEDA